ncbi:MAG: hypothetical protein M0Q38_16935 [Bacteroidales bacterium]|nr:hypothetical protein [Bacteroidales bacterium]
MTKSTTLNPPTSPIAGTHISTYNQIEWYWNAVPGATGYKWNNANDSATATKIGSGTTKTETGLNCNTSYTRYLWAYGNCGTSPVTILIQSTTLNPPSAPVAGIHIAYPTQITWNWNAVPGATGYKWNNANDSTTAAKIGSGTTKTETGLNCNTSYTRYLWAYGNCGTSPVTILTQSTTLNPPANPVAATHVPSPTQIVWKWISVPGATGYKWNWTNDSLTATKIGSDTTKTETGLNCNHPYTRYLWAYGNCGTSPVTILTKSTTLNPPANPVAATHVPSPTQIVWKWISVPGASGYKWNWTNDSLTATKIGSDTTKTETGLNCNHPYTRYLWAYGNCGTSPVTILTKSTTLNPPANPVVGTHVPSPTQIVWKWNKAPAATGYKWSASNDSVNATNMGSDTTHTETGLTCNTSYTRYIWAYNNCGTSIETTLTAVTTLNPPAAPVAGTHVSYPTQITWNWNVVQGATGYKWNTVNDTTNAYDIGLNTTKTEYGLQCMTPFNSYVWAYNNCGISSATLLSDTTLWCCGKQITDNRDSTTYNTVLIGTQCWMSQNLNLGTLIPGNTEQTNHTIIEKYCYNNDEANCTVYGGLYQWDNMMQWSTTPGVQGICPTGWHIPTDGEWTALTDYLGGVSFAGGKMKEAGTTHWLAPNTGATNVSGFSALPGGYRSTTGAFSDLTDKGHFWSSTENSTVDSWTRHLFSQYEYIDRVSSSKYYGKSVRCLKD